MTDLIKKQLDDYFEKVVSKDASEAQRIETTRAFYAGAVTVNKLYMQMSENHITEDHACRVLGTLNKELQAYIDAQNPNKRR